MADTNVRVVDGNTIVQYVEDSTTATLYGADYLQEIVGGAIAAAEEATADAEAAAAGVAANAALAAGHAIDAAASAVASGLARDGSVAARLLSETAAGVAGAYLDAIEVLTGGAPVSGTLTMQAADRTIMGAITGQSAGAQVYLGEAGRQGVFIWTAGDQSANVTADTYQAYWVPPASDTDGSSGAWHRQHYGLAQATWAGVVASGIGNYAAQLTALLAHAETWVVELPNGTVGTGAAVQVPTGKALIGKGQDSSFIKATSLTGFETATANHKNCLVWLTGTGARAFDFGVDGDKLGTHDIGGVHAYLAKQFAVQRVTARNTSAYAFWGVTTLNYAVDACNGVFRDCWSFNANVHFETTAANNILFERCHARDGDGDVTCETMFHPITGSKKITYRDCTGISAVAASAISVGAYTAEPVEDILFENVSIELSSGGVLMAINGFSSTVTRLRINDCDLRNANQIGISVDVAGGAIDFEVNGGRIEALGVGISADEADAKVSGTEIVMRNTSGGATVYPVAVAAAGTLVLDAPTFDTDRAFAYPQLFPAGSNVTVIGQPIIRVDPGPTLVPMGIGHRVRKVLPVDVAMTALGAIASGETYAFQFQGLAEGKYRARVAGSYQAPITNGLYLAADGYGTRTLAGTIDFETRTDGTSRAHAAVTGTASAASSSVTGTAATSFPIAADFMVKAGSGSPGIEMTAAPWAGGVSGTLLFDAGTMFELEMVA